jgi:hypothetical protein
VKKPKAATKVASKAASKSLTKADRELIEAATATIKRRYRDDWQEVGAALRTRSGKIFGVTLRGMPRADFRL